MGTKTWRGTLASASMTRPSRAALPRYVVAKMVLAAISASMRWCRGVKSGSLLVPPPGGGADDPDPTLARGPRTPGRHSPPPGGCGVWTPDGIVRLLSRKAGAGLAPNGGRARKSEPLHGLAWRTAARRAAAHRRRQQCEQN